MDDFTLTMDELEGPLYEDNYTDEIGQAIRGLPILSKDQIPLDDNCGICLQSFTAIVEGETQNEGSCDIDGEEVQLSGVTKLEGCGHIFCRLDLIEWIKGYHGTCPTCRHQFLEISQPLEEDAESIDEDYIPDPDDFLDSDGFTDADDFELDPDEMDLDGDEDSDMMGPDSLEGYDLERLYDEALDEGQDGGDGGQADPGLSDSYGSESLSEEEVLAGLGGDGVLSILDDAGVVYPAEGEAARPVIGGSRNPAPEQTK